VCSDILGASQSSYSLTAADVGSRVRVKVLATNLVGPSTAVSNRTQTVAAAAPANSQAPALSGVARDGETLSADPGDWSGTAPLSYTYQWKRCDAGGCTDVGAGEQTYSLSAADVGATVRVQVTATNVAGSSTATSDATQAVAAAPPANSQAPAISGTAQDGETLTADPGDWSGTAPLSYGYQWRRCDAEGDGCNDIEGATERTYTVGAEDVGATIRVVVTATNSVGEATDRSAPTPVVPPL
jgi:hypothetical protein